MLQQNRFIDNIISQLAPEPTVSVSNQKYLRFSLAHQEDVLLALEQIFAIFNISPPEILPIPEMPDCVLGIYNWREKNLWLIDIAHLVDYPPLSSPIPAQLTTIVIQIEGMLLGLVTSEVKDIESHTAQLQAPYTYLHSPRLLAFTQGYSPSAECLVLDINAIARFPLWQVHRS